MDSSQELKINEQKHPYLPVFGILAVLTVLEVLVEPFLKYLSVLQR
jgi:hypothetical protein